MNKNKTFRVAWETGYIKVNIGNFFGRCTLTDSNKLLKLAKIHCTEEQRFALIQDLEEAKQDRWSKTERTRIEKCIQKIKAQKWGQGKKGKSC